MPAIPQSEVLAKFLQEIGEKCGENLAKFFADFRPSISRENGRKKFHEKSSTFSTVHQIKFFFTAATLGALGPNGIFLTHTELKLNCKARPSPVSGGVGLLWKPFRESRGKEQHWGFVGIPLEPAKTYILRGTPRTYAIKTRAVTDN